MESRPKKRVCLSISDKLKLIQESETGVSTTALSAKYNISIRTVQKLLSVKESERQSFQSCSQTLSGSRKYRCNPKFSDIDEAVFLWFSQQRSMGKPAHGGEIQKIAIIFNEKLESCPDFQASNGWLGKFKKRHGIRAVPIQGEKLSDNHEAASQFPEEFQRTVQDVHPANLYNADEGGLFWRAFPTRTLVGPEEVRASALQRNEDRVTFLFCANAMGTHALPLLMIGKSKIPSCWRGIKDFTKLPVVYTNQSHARMTAMIFLDWYGNHFTEEVRKRQQSDGITGRVVLLLDRAGCHPPKDCLDDVESGFSVEYLPPLCASVLQPMSQGAIETMKRGYRRALLRKLLNEGQEQTVTAFQKAFTLNDGAHLAAQAWGEVHPFTLARVWQKLLGEELADRSASPPSPGPSILEQLKTVAPDILEAEAEEWLLVDDGEPGHVIMTVEQIVDSVRGVNADDGLQDHVDVGLDANGSDANETGAYEPGVDDPDAYDSDEIEMKMEVLEVLVEQPPPKMEVLEVLVEQPPPKMEVLEVLVEQPHPKMEVLEVLVEQPPLISLQDAVSGLTTAISWLQQNSDPRSNEFRLQLEHMVKEIKDF